MTGLELYNGEVNLRSICIGCFDVAIDYRNQ